MFSREEVNITFLSELFVNAFTNVRPLNASDQTIARALIDAIPSDCRDYFVYHDIIGMTFSEMADYFGVDEKVVQRKNCEAKILLSTICRKYVVDALSQDEDEETRYIELSHRIQQSFQDTTDDDSPHKSWKTESVAKRQKRVNSLFSG